MRKFCWQRWALIFLLMGRLVIGELGHAMSSANVDAVEQAISLEATDATACPSHAGDELQMPAAHHAGSSTDIHCSSEQSPSEPDCCKSGDCKCPCLHIPCAGLDALLLNPVATSLLSAPHGTHGMASQRPSGLFRPPA